MVTCCFGILRALLGRHRNCLNHIRPLCRLAPVHCPILSLYAHISFQRAASLHFFPLDCCHPSHPRALLCTCEPLRRRYQCVFLLSVVILLRFFLSHFSFFLTRLCLCTLTVDGAVSAKIADELAYKKEAATEGEPDFLKEFENS